MSISIYNRTQTHIHTNTHSHAHTQTKTPHSHHIYLFFFFTGSTLSFHGYSSSSLLPSSIIIINTFITFSLSCSSLSLTISLFTPLSLSSLSPSWFCSSHEPPASSEQQQATNRSGNSLFFWPNHQQPASFSVNTRDLHHPSHLHLLSVQTAREPTSPCLLLRAATTQLPYCVFS